MQVASSIAGSLMQDAARTSQERTQESAALKVQKLANDMVGQTELALIQSVTGTAPAEASGNLGQNVNIKV
ncbi:MAG: putative motility protein [Ketobacteraceae bacterium]|nr:putative motility protein [Ketobacteraceae bacterium]